MSLRKLKAVKSILSRLPLNLKKKLGQLIESGEITGVDLTRDGVRLAQLKKTATGFKLLNLLQAPRSENLTQLLEENQINIAKLIVSIPRSLTTVKYLRLPSTDSAEIRDMVGTKLTV